MTIDYDASEVEPDVAEARGWRRTTPCPEPGHRSRCYEDTAPTCDIAEATAEHFTRSVSEIKRRGVPTDFTGATKWNQARATRANWPALTVMDDDDAIRWMVDASDVTLNEAADRGSAIHRAIEALLAGNSLDHDDLERNGALSYVAAMHAFLSACAPEPELVEAVCFDRGHMVAGTVDFVGRLTVAGERTGRLCVDFKTRTGDSHDRRPAEAVQVGAYAHMLTTGYYMDDRGRRARVDGFDGGAIVTLAADGTFAVHPVDIERAIAGYHRALEVAGTNLVSHYYDRAVKGDPLDIAAVVTERLAGIDKDSPEYTELARAWTAHGLPRRDQATGEWLPPFTVEDWPTVDELLTRAEPFAGPNPAPVACATEAEIAEVTGRLSALPDDLRTDVIRAAGGLCRLDAAVIDASDLDEWERLITPAESTVGKRRFDLEVILGQLDEDPAGRTAVLAVLPQLGEVDRWTDDDVERAAEVVDAYLAGDLILRDGALIVSPRVIESLPKTETTTKAKAVCTQIGRPRPTKFADVMGDVVVYAAVRAA
jgi:hypothetical protein